MPKLKALKDFVYSFDGIHVQSFVAGREYEFLQSHVKTLIERGYCAEIITESAKDIQAPQNKIAKYFDRKKSKGK